MNITVAFRWRIRSSSSPCRPLLFLCTNPSPPGLRAHTAVLLYFPVFALSSSGRLASPRFFHGTPLDALTLSLFLPRHASSSTVVIIYRSPFSAQVIPAKIVASVNYYCATSLHLWISIVPRSGDLLLLRIIPVKRGKFPRVMVTVQSFRLKD